MYKVIFMLKFRKDITPDYARKEWLGSHGALALTIPGLRRYVQNHWMAPAEGHEQVYDGSLELFFDSEEAFKTSFASPEGTAMLKDDLRLFDRSMTPAYVGGVVEEHVMLEGNIHAGTKEVYV
ncbi:MAG: EthD family reductase [Ferruginibacter sp.]|nr:EthD family reductase [Ferruginibacter sp.]